MSKSIDDYLCEQDKWIALAERNDLQKEIQILFQNILDLQGKENGYQEETNRLEDLEKKQENLGLTEDEVKTFTKSYASMLKSLEGAIEDEREYLHSINIKLDNSQYNNILIPKENNDLKKKFDYLVELRLSSAQAKIELQHKINNDMLSEEDERLKFLEYQKKVEEAIKKNQELEELRAQLAKQQQEEAERENQEKIKKEQEIEAKRLEEIKKEQEIEAKRLEEINKQEKIEMQNRYDKEQEKINKIIDTINEINAISDNYVVHLPIGKAEEVFTSLQLDIRSLRLTDNDIIAQLNNAAHTAYCNFHHMHDMYHSVQQDLVFYDDFTAEGPGQENCAKEEERPASPQKRREALPKKNGESEGGFKINPNVAEEGECDEEFASMFNNEKEYQNGRRVVVQDNSDVASQSDIAYRNSKIYYEQKDFDIESQSTVKVGYERNINKEKNTLDNLDVENQSDIEDLDLKVFKQKYSNQGEDFDIESQSNIAYRNSKVYYEQKDLPEIKSLKPKLYNKDNSVISTAAESEYSFQDLNSYTKKEESKSVSSWWYDILVHLIEWIWLTKEEKEEKKKKVELEKVIKEIVDIVDPHGIKSDFSDIFKKRVTDLLLFKGCPYESSKKLLNILKEATNHKRNTFELVDEFKNDNQYSHLYVKLSQEVKDLCNKSEHTTSKQLSSLNDKIQSIDYHNNELAYFLIKGFDGYQKDLVFIEELEAGEAGKISE